MASPKDHIEVEDDIEVVERFVKQINGFVHDVYINSKKRYRALTPREAQAYLSGYYNGR